MHAFAVDDGEFHIAIKWCGIYQLPFHDGGRNTPPTKAHLDLDQCESTSSCSPAMGAKDRGEYCQAAGNPQTLNVNIAALRTVTLGTEC